MHPLDAFVALLVGSVSLFIIWDFIRSMLKIAVYVIACACICGLVVFIFLPHNDIPSGHSFVLDYIESGESIYSSKIVTQFLDYITRFLPNKNDVL